MKNVDLRTNDLKKIVEAFELERDKLLDQVQYLKGSAERLEWVIKIMNTQLDRIQKEEQQRELLAEQQRLALEAAKARGNLGVHPSMSERRADLTERRNGQTSQEAKQEDNDPKKGKKKDKPE